jgi:predicted alpha/beta hydrolase family esterase
MKHAVIVHGFKGAPDTNWKPWLKRELEAGGFRVDVPTMPDTEHPDVSAWVDMLARTVGGADAEEVYLIGHSLGCITILKYLESLGNQQKVKACVFVAGFSQRFDGYEGGHDSFFAKSLDWEKVKSHCDTFIAVHSKDDQNVGFDQLKIFEDNLGAKAILVDGMGHFGSADGVFEVPLIKEVLVNI